MSIYKINRIFKLFGVGIVILSMTVLFDFNISITLGCVYFALMFLDFIYCYALRKTHKVRYVPTNKTICTRLLPYVLCIVITELICYFIA